MLKPDLQSDPPKCLYRKARPLITQYAERDLQIEHARQAVQKAW